MHGALGNQVGTVWAIERIETKNLKYKHIADCIFVFHLGTSQHFVLSQGVSLAYFVQATLCVSEQVTFIELYSVWR